MAELKGNYFVDMPDNSPMRSEAVSLVSFYICIYIYIYQAKYAVENLKVENKISHYIKTNFDAKFGPNWNCIVGQLH